MKPLAGYIWFFMLGGCCGVLVMAALEFLAR